jgi:hypothetical protein
MYPLDGYCSGLTGTHQTQLLFGSSGYLVTIHSFIYMTKTKKFLNSTNPKPSVKLILYMYNYNLGISVKLVNLVGLNYKFYYIIIIR